MRIKITSSNHEEIRQALVEYNQKLGRQQDLIEYQKALKLNGKCFKFKNSYGSGRSWWLFIKIIDVNTDFTRVLAIQKMDNALVEVQVKNDSHYMYTNTSNYIPIEEKEFRRETRKILKEIKDHVSLI